MMGAPFTPEQEARVRRWLQTPPPPNALTAFRDALIEDVKRNEPRDA